MTVHLRGPMRLALEQLLGRPPSRTPGTDTRALIEAADAGAVDTLLCLGGNLFGANPHSTQSRRALGSIDTIAYLATKPNTCHVHGLGAQHTLLLPVFNRFETPHRTTVESGNNWVRLNEPGSTHLRGSEPIDWRRLQDPVYVRELIARTLPGYEAIAGTDASRREFEVSGRVFHEPRFPTATGRARSTSAAWPPASGAWCSA